jgi:hypothetical protein
MPERLTLSRRKGWRLPEGALSVARPTIWGNPFTVAALQTTGWQDVRPEVLAGVCAEAFRDWLAFEDLYWSGDAAMRGRREMILSRLPELRGRDLACWCKPGCPCHAEVLLELANA